MNASQQFKHYLDIAWRRKWWVVVPVVLSLVASQVVLKKLPKMYRASTTILVTPQRLPEDFVRTTVTQRIEDRMSSMTVQILSRSFLEQVAREIGRINDQSSEVEIERECARLRGRVEIEAGKNLSYFEVAALDEKPENSANIANRLASLFIGQNSQMRSEQATGTRATVEGWLAKKKQELDETDAKIAAYKRGHLWEISDQLHSNFELLETGRSRIQGVDKEIQRLQERLTDLQQQAKLEESLGTKLATDPDPSARQLAALEAELNKLLVSYTDENPIVKQKRSEIADFRRVHPQLAQPQTPADATETVAASRNPEIDRTERELASLKRDRANIESQMGLVTGRIDRTPLRDQELQNLTRGYDQLKKEYEDLLAKRDQAIRAEELETSRKSEQFRVQDEARTPSAPFRPQPLIVLGICLAAGLGLGIGAVVILEFLDQSLKSEDEFREAFPDVPLLSAVPHVDPDSLEAEKRGRSRRRPPSGRHAAMTTLAVICCETARIFAGWTA